MAVTLIESTHTYVNDKNPLMKYTSVTTVLGKYKEKFDEQKWSKIIAQRRGVSQEAILAEWKKINSDANEYGTAFHLILEKFLLSPYRQYTPRDDFEKRVITAFSKCCGENKLNLTVTNTLQPERIMSLEFEGRNEGIAGTSDIIEDLPLDFFNVWDFKGLALDTPIPTKEGFKTMGETQVGDIIFDGNGELTTVQHVSEIHHNPTYEIVFDTNDKIVCDHEHRWVVVERKAKNRYNEVELTTEELCERFQKKKLNKALRIKCVGINLEHDIPLPIDPYVLGVWLGGGSEDCGMVTNMNPMLWAEIKNRNYEIGEDVSQGNAGLAESRTIYNIRGELGKLNLLNNKHIPELYQRASNRQRLDLLRGIMDTDGSYHKKRQRCYMITTQNWQAYDLASLIASLGWKPTVMKAETSCGVIKNIPTLHVSFKPAGVSPFLTRNHDYLDVCGPDFEKSKFRYIKSIKKTESVPTKCLSVSSETHCYLATVNFIKTHNTNKAFNFENKYREAMKFPLSHLQYCEHNSYALQLSLYAVMYEKETGKKFNRGGLFYWDKIEETFQLININYLKRDAEMLLRHFETTTAVV